MSFKEHIRLAFCDDGVPSSSRILTAMTFVVSCIGFLYVVFKTQRIPDGMSMTGLGGFAASPYAINRASKMFGHDKDDNTVGGNVDTTVIVKK